MLMIKRADASISTNMYGNASPTLVFVHGSYIDQTYWNEQVEYFRKSYRVLTLDLPGHGRSGRERHQWSTVGFSEDIVFLLKEYNLTNVILIGHSWGADVCLMTAVSYPQVITGFIAIDYYKNAAIAVAPPDQIQAIKADLKSDFSDTNEKYCKTALLTPHTPSAIADRVITDFRNAYEPMGQAIMREFFESYKIQETLLPQLHSKLYLINCDYQPTNEEALQRYCKHGFQVLQIKGTCHFPMLEKPQELNVSLNKVIQMIWQDD